MKRDFDCIDLTPKKHVTDLHFGYNSVDGVISPKSGIDSESKARAKSIRGKNHFVCVDLTVKKYASDLHFGSNNVDSESFAESSVPKIKTHRIRYNRNPEIQTRKLEIVDKRARKPVPSSVPFISARVEKNSSKRVIQVKMTDPIVESISVLYNDMFIIKG